MNLAYGSGRLVELSFNFFLTLLVKHPIAFLLSLAVSLYATYGITKFVAADVKRRNEKLGVKPPESSDDIFVVLVFFALLLWGLCSLFIWLGSLLVDYLDL